MLRRLSPFLLTVLCAMLDTTIFSMIYSGTYAVPLTIVLVFLIGMLIGRMNGLLYGMIGGLIIDITTGSLGAMTFFFMAAGFMIGLILYNPHERIIPSRKNIRKQQFFRALWVFALYSVGEIVILVYQYFHTATLLPIYFINISVRAVICTALTVLLRPFMHSILIGRRNGKAASRTREVKSF